MSKRDMVQKRLQMLNSLREDLRELNSHRKDILDESEGYNELEEKSKLVKEQAAEKKKQILAIPEYDAVIRQIKDIRIDIEDQKDALSQELIELYREEGITEIEDSKGNIKKLKFSVRLVNP